MHRNAVEVPNGQRANLTQLDAQKRARHREVKTAILHKILGKRNDVWRLLDLVKEHERLPRDKPTAAQDAYCLNRLVGALCAGQGNGGSLVAEKVNLNEVGVFSPCELLYQVCLSHLSRTVNQQGLATIRLLPLQKVAIDVAFEHVGSSPQT